MRRAALVRARRATHTAHATNEMQTHICVRALVVGGSGDMQRSSGQVQPFMPLFQDQCKWRCVVWKIESLRNETDSACEMRGERVSCCAFRRFGVLDYACAGDVDMKALPSALTQFTHYYTHAHIKKRGALRLIIIAALEPSVKCSAHWGVCHSYECARIRYKL